jgi:hypothetical protein
VLLFTLNICLSRRSTGRKIGAWFGQQFLYFFVVGLLVVGWGQDMIGRFADTLDKTEPFHTLYHTANKWRKELPTLLGWREPSMPENAVALGVDALGNNAILTPTDQQPTPVIPGDVYVEVPNIEWVIDTETGEPVATETPRTYSKNAEDWGLSMGIRFDTLWPNAWRGFLRNPLLGSGYATLTKGEQLKQFTEADSTDNNFLRILGETGLLGFVAFFGAIGWALVLAWQRLNEFNPWRRLYIIGFICATVGLLINAILIDVFAASKVAYSFWMLMGLFFVAARLTIAPAATAQTPPEQAVAPPIKKSPVAKRRATRRKSKRSRQTKL